MEQLPWRRSALRPVRRSPRRIRCIWSWGGYYQQFFGFSDQKDTATEPGPVNYQNAEVYFKMRGELDNGLKIGGRIELEGENGGDQIDQAYLTLSGGFGQLRLGAINSGR